MKKMTKLNFLIVIALAYTVTLSCKKDEAVVAPKLLTYNADIKSIMVANCTPCHMPGGIRANKWDDYTTTKNNVSFILDRIQRDVTAAGFMPRGGTKPVSTAEIAKIQQWVKDGLLEN
jgi:mono/diheme cytochrome c family protein